LNGTNARVRIAVRAALLGACAIGTGLADDLKNGLARCAAIASRDDRLVCYDALSGTRSPTRAPAPSMASPDAPPLPAPAPMAQGAAPPMPAAAAPETERPEDFGLTPVQRGLVQKHILSITARVSAFSYSKLGRVQVVLDNGQTWELDEPDPLLAPGDFVTIRRAALGSFLLITPTKRSHRVHRTL